MRLLNWVLHLAIVALLCWGMGLHAQTQGNLPNVIDSVIDGVNGGGCGAGCINYPEPIAINDTIVCGISADTSGPYLPTDTLANTWTCTTPTATPVPRNNAIAYMCYTKSTSAGVDQILLAASAGFQQMSCGRWANMGAVDGAVATATATPANDGSVHTISTTNTTVTNNDLAITLTGVANFSGTVISPGNDSEYIAFQGRSIPTTQPLFTQKHCGVAGSCVVSTNDLTPASSSATTLAMQTLAFKPVNTIAIADTVLPDAAASIAYSAQLHCIGGTTTQTYSLFSGSFPAGISLNTATGAITGSTASLGTSALGFRCTDGIVTSATQSINLTVGGGFSTPSVLQNLSTNFLNAGTGQTINLTSPSRCGDVIVALAKGDDTHNGEGYVQAVSGTNNFIHDAFSSPIQRIVGPIPGMNAYPNVVYVIGPLTQSGIDTLTVKNNTGASSGNSITQVVELSGVQAVVDFGAFVNQMTSASSGTFSASYTTVVPNTLLLAVSNTDRGSSVPSVSLGAPFSALTTGGDSTGYSTYASALIASASSVTGTSSYTGALSGNQTSWSELIVPFRAGLPVAACNNFVGAGEKIRRQVW